MGCSNAVVRVSFMQIAVARNLRRYVHCTAGRRCWQVRGVLASLCTAEANAIAFKGVSVQSDLAFVLQFTMFITSFIKRQRAPFSARRQV